MNKNKYPLNVGIFGIGLEAYWERFDGLKEKLESYVAFVSNKISKYDVQVCNLGLIDNTDKAFDAGHVFRQSDIDVIFLYITTYSLSSSVFPVVQRARVPVIILNLSPEASINYSYLNALTSRTEMTAEWLAYCSACPVPEIINVFKKSGIPFHQVTGILNDNDKCWDEIGEWIEVAKVMQHNRLGAMGHYYSGMLDVYTDLTAQLAYFGL